MRSVPTYHTLFLHIAACNKLLHAVNGHRIVMTYCASFASPRRKPIRLLTVHSHFIWEFNLGNNSGSCFWFTIVGSHVSNIKSHKWLASVVERERETEFIFTNVIIFMTLSEQKDTTFLDELLRSEYGKNWNTRAVLWLAYFHSKQFFFSWGFLARRHFEINIWR
jgi:hypothetical protein